MKKNGKFSFWIDRGGTFTDIVALSPTGEVSSFKLLSQSDTYADAVVEGIHRVMQPYGGYNSELVSEIRMGTTVATNTFLERRGSKSALVTTLGFSDLLKIRYQNRPRLFDLHVQKVSAVSDISCEILERMDSSGNIVIPLDEEIARFELERLLELGVESVAIAFMHSTLNPSHEIQVGRIAQSLGFKYVSLSHEISSVPKLVGRAESSLMDAYLSPELFRFTERLSSTLEFSEMLFMQSHGGLCKGSELKGHKALLSGPAGGYVAATKVCQNKGFDKIITFDMGGTSTDVALYDGGEQIQFEPQFQGLGLQVPMLDIHTVAAGGGSILFAEEGRLRVGPESAVADPGPACYRRGGPLTVTDANLYLNRIKGFPKIFGPNNDKGLDIETVKEKFKALAQELDTDPIEIAESFLQVAVENMAMAIRTVSIAKGYDPSEFVLCCFGGAGAQLACKVAERLSIPKVFIHPLSSVMSALGMGLTEEKNRETRAVAQPLSEVSSEALEKAFKSLRLTLEKKLSGDTQLISKKFFQLKTRLSDHFIEVQSDNPKEAREKYEIEYKRLFGFESSGELELQAVSLELACPRSFPKFSVSEVRALEVSGPHRVSEPFTTVVIDKGWNGIRDVDGSWTLSLISQRQEHRSLSEADMEISYQRLQSIAEEMGTVLKHTGFSVNIKERLDYSCAIFTSDCELIANAPHMPVHLGSMSECVLSIHQKFGASMQDGDSYISNSPLEGGTHLPDVTVVTPLIVNGKLEFYLASRGHHADIGGISPGSMPSVSRSLDEEGIVIESQLLARGGQLLETKMMNLLMRGPYPARSVSQNMHDLKAQVASNQRGLQALQQFIHEVGLQRVKTNANNLLQYTTAKLKEALKDFKSGQASVEVEGGRRITVTLEHQDSLKIDFTGTSSRDLTNFNAPKPVTKAAILYSLRCLLNEDIPLNDGLSKNLEIIIPDKSLLDPGTNTAVVAGNVETSQIIVDALLEALGVMAHSAGTMSNFSFGNETHQYYETIGGGSGAGKGFPGVSGSQLHMTNSRLTDPEVLETRFPIRLQNFSIRRGSGGLGHYRGGDGLDRRFLFLEDLECHLLSQRREFAPKGLNEGEEGLPGIGFLDNGQNYEELKPCFHLPAQSGSELLLSTPAGGGFGKRKFLSGHKVFAYGSNLDEHQFQQRCPSHVILGRGRLKDHTIHYSLYSDVRQGGVADIKPSVGDEVWGLVYWINDEDLARLDDIEGHPNDYLRIEVQVEMDNKEIQKVWIYDVCDKRPHIEPSNIYQWLVFKGAWRLGAPFSYLKKIKYIC